MKKKYVFRQDFDPKLPLYVFMTRKSIFSSFTAPVRLFGSNTAKIICFLNQIWPKDENFIKKFALKRRELMFFDEVWAQKSLDKGYLGWKIHFLQFYSACATFWVKYSENYFVV